MKLAWAAGGLAGLGLALSVSGAGAGPRGGRARALQELRDARRQSAAEDLAAEVGSDWTQVLVRTAPGRSQTVARRHGAAIHGRVAGWELVTPTRGGDKFAWYLSLQRDGDVLQVTPNHRARHPGCRQMSIDVFEIGARMDLTSQTALRTVRAEEGLPAGDSVVAVVDSGVALVEELEGRLLPGIDLLAPGASGLPHGRGRDRSSRAGGPSTASAWDANGHGTAVATLIAAVARDARILPVRVVGADCVGTAFDLAAGIELAAEAGADVINVSLSLDRDNPAVTAAVETAQARGALIVAASGNNGVVEHPAALPGVIAVTAVGEDDWPASFAALGPEVDLAAPGVNVVARAPGDGGGTYLYASLTGTSPSAALVSGAAAVLAGRAPHATVDERRAVLRSLVRPTRSLHPSLSGQIGEGILDLAPLR